ncbi:MAG: 4-hydroxy-tetrahydrodipicolinate synthase [Candidatus Korobacteraceae bacterium]|jgi:4-hydroxy-tetrahydrodipicolinate synthase
MNDQLARLRGSIPPLITPFRNGEVDYKTYERLLEFHVENGSHGVLVNGTTGEPSTLTVDERNRLVELAVRKIRGRIPVVAATGSQSLADTKELTSHAVKAGADALLIVTPYYIRPPQRGIIEYYLDVTKDYDVPWMVYHIPGRAAIQVTLDTIEQLASRSKTFVGMKQAVADLGFVSECLEAVGPDFRVFVGLEELSFPMMTVGAVGLMNAAGNLNPRAFADLCEAVWSNNLSRGRELHQRFFQLNKAIFFDTNPIPLKYMMKRIGLIERNEHRLPMAPATPELEKRLDRVLENAGLFSVAGVGK